MALYFGYYVRKLLFTVKKKINVLYIYIFHICFQESNVMWSKNPQVINNANGVESISPIKNIYFFTSLSMYYFTVITQLEIQS